MATELKLPELAESMTSAAVTAWLKQPGDRVSAGDPIVEVDTDKTTVEVEAPVSGVLRQIVVDAGTEDVEVGAVLALIDDDDAAASAADGGVGHTEVEPTPAAGPVTRAEPPTVRARAPTSATTHDEQLHVNLDANATPLARRMAAVAGLDLSAVAASGQGGRILKSDIDRALGREAPPAPEYTEPSLSAMRRVTATRMAESKRTVPHFYLSAECDMTDLIDRRQRHNEQGTASRLPTSWSAPPREHCSRCRPPTQGGTTIGSGSMPSRMSPWLSTPPAVSSRR